MPNTRQSKDKNATYELGKFDKVFLNETYGPPVERKNAEEPISALQPVNVQQTAKQLGETIRSAAEEPADAMRPQNVVKEKPRDKVPQR